MTPSDEAIRAVLTDLALRRGKGKTFCPSAAAREIGGAWRGHMAAVRRVAGMMQDEGALQASQRGASVDPRQAKGPIRLGVPGSQGAQPCGPSARIKGRKTALPTAFSAPQPRT